MRLECMELRTCENMPKPVDIEHLEGENMANLDAPDEFIAFSDCARHNFVHHTLHD